MFFYDHHSTTLSYDTCQVAPLLFIPIQCLVVVRTLLDPTRCKLYGLFRLRACCDDVERSMWNAERETRLLSWFAPGLDTIRVLVLFFLFCEVSQDLRQEAVSASQRNRQPFFPALDTIRSRFATLLFPVAVSLTRSLPPPTAPPCPHLPLLP